MALVQGLDSADYVHIFDSHSRNSVCMPDCDGTAVVMKCFNINYLEEYLSSLPCELHSGFLEIVPVEFTQSSSQFDENNAKCSGASDYVSLSSTETWHEGFLRRDNEFNICESQI